ncbi:unnamed protein product, partial [Cylicostephanus goldi]
MKPNDNYEISKIGSARLLISYRHPKQRTMLHAMTMMMWRPFSPERDRSKACGVSGATMGIMSVSMSTYPRSSNQFAPPPMPNSFNISSVFYKENRPANQTAPIYDSSGVGSMAPSAFSDTSRGSRRMPMCIPPALATPRRTRRSLPSTGQQLITISYK